MTDFDVLSRELMRALRGARSREAMARRLSVSVNAIYAWETGRRVPTALTLFRAAERDGQDVRASLGRFLGDRELLHDVPLESICARLLGELRGSEAVSAVARRAGVDRSALSRWLSGAAIPRVPELLGLIDACGSRVLDFATLFAEPAELPSLGEVWKRVRATRRLAVEHPWAAALLVAFELEEVRAAAAHPPGFLGARVGLDAEAEAGCLALLEEVGLVVREGERWRAPERPPVALLAPEARQRMRAWAAAEAARRIGQGEAGIFGFVAFTASEADHKRLVALHEAYADAVKAIALNPSGHDRVYVLNAHLFPLDRQEPA